MQANEVLTQGEWEALLFQAPQQVRALAYRLAIHHGAVKRPAPTECPRVPAMSKKRENSLSGLRRETMDMASAITTTLAFAGGVAADWLRQQWFSNREIRKAVRAEIPRFLVELNFSILDAMDRPNAAQAPLTARVGGPLRLQSFEYYWQEKRERLLRLPEWPLLQGWNEALGSIGQRGHPALFDAIMLFERLTMTPLDKCISRETRRFVRNVIDRPEVSKYKMDYLLKASRLSLNP